VTLLVGDEERAVGIEADAVGGAESGGEDVGVGAVGADAEERAVMGDDFLEGVACRFGLVEVACGIRLETHGEFMEVLGDLVVGVEAFDEVGFAVGVEVVEFCELIAAADEDGAVDDFQAERLEEAGGDAAPFEFAERLLSEA
jgi:hypothetical protein